MQTMSTWEMVLLGGLALLVLFWAGLLVPLLLVVAFVMLLMKMV